MGRDVAVIIHYDSCNAGRDSSTIKRERVETRYRHHGGAVLRALGYEMKCDGVTGTNRMDSRQQGRVAPCDGGKKPSIFMSLGPMMKGGYERARARVGSWETA
jgi:hypothetical protein